MHDLRPLAAASLALAAVVARPAAAQERAGPAAGTVVDASGAPAGGVAVLRVGPGDGPDVVEGRVGDLYGADLASTDDAGRFAFADAPDGPYRLIALGEAGYGESAVVRPGGGDGAGDGGGAGDGRAAVALAPWGRIEGVARVGGSPCPGAAIHASLDEPLDEGWGITPSADHFIITHADADGHFALERLKPGRWEVAQGVPFAPGAIPYPSHAVRVDVAPGGTTEVTIGGTGRAIVGRLDLPALDPPAVAHLALLQNEWSPTVVPPATFGEVQAMTQPDREALAETPAFRAYADDVAAALERRKFCAFTVQPDGRFRIDDVPPGEYAHLYVNVAQPGAGGATFEAERSVVVPPADGEGGDGGDGGEGGEGAAPIDLGTLAVRRVVNLAVGDAVPDVSFAVVGGGERKLSDFAGRFVLLDAWATWCGPCVGETPNVRATREAHAGDDRLVVVGLSMDDAPAAAANYTRAEGLDWVDGFIGQADTTDVDDQLGINGIPDIRLIGPDGRLVATGLRGDAIGAAVETALAETPAAPGSAAPGSAAPEKP